MTPPFYSNYPRTPAQQSFDYSTQLSTPFSPEYSPCYYHSHQPQHHYGTPALSTSPMVSRQQTMPEFSPPSLSPLNLMFSLPQRSLSSSEATHSQIYPKTKQESLSESPTRLKLRNPKDSKGSHALKALRQLQAVKITASDLLTYVVKGEDGFKDYQSAFFSPSNRGSLLDLLNAISTHAKGSPIFDGWVGPRALKIVCEKIHKEMEAAKPDLRMSTKEVTPEFIENWDINSLMDPIAEKITPTFTAVVIAATESKLSALKPKGPRSRNQKTVSS